MHIPNIPVVCVRETVLAQRTVTAWESPLPPTDSMPPPKVKAIDNLLISLQPGDRCENRLAAFVWV